MTTGIKFISICNVILAGIFIANMIFLEKSQLSYPFASYINLVSIATLLSVTLIILLRVVRLVGFARILVYVLMLALGLQVLLTIKYLFTSYGLLTIVIDVLVIFYAIGVRGYLASKTAAEYFTRVD